MVRFCRVVVPLFLLTFLVGCWRSGPKAPPEWTSQDRRKILDEQDWRAKLIEKGEKLAYEGEKKREEGERVREEPVSLKTGDRIQVDFPYTEKDGIPVLALLEETGCWQVDRWFKEVGVPAECRLGQQSLLPTLVIWSNGRILWRHELVFFFQTHIPPRRVQEVLSSIQIEAYNTKRNMDYAHAARSLQGGVDTGPEYMVLFVSKGDKENIILRSPFHFWREGIGSHVYWDELSYQEDSYDSGYPWSAFAQQQPKRFFTYLRQWESLEAKILPLLPEKAGSSKRLDYDEKITLLRCRYEFRDGNPPQWIRVVPKKLPVAVETGKPEEDPR